MECQYSCDERSWDTGTVLCMFTCLEEQNMDYEKCYEQALAMIELLKKNCEKYSEEICMAGNYEDILKNEQNGQISAVLTIEEGGIINGKRSVWKNCGRRVYV